MISLYQASIQPCLRTLTNLMAILAIAEEHCTARKIEPAVLLQSRLYPDMLPLVRQVQIASDTARRLAARLAGTEAPSMADTETTFAEVQHRLAASIDYLKSLEPQLFEGSETREVSVPTREGELRMPGLVGALNFAIPNLYFHAVTAFAILRHNGIEIGKKDFLGPHEA